MLHTLSEQIGLHAQTITVTPGILVCGLQGSVRLTKMVKPWAHIRPLLENHAECEELKLRADSPCQLLPQGLICRPFLEAKPRKLKKMPIAQQDQYDVDLIHNSI